MLVRCHCQSDASYMHLQVSSNCSQHLKKVPLAKCQNDALRAIACPLCCIAPRSAIDKIVNLVKSFKKKFIAVYRNKDIANLIVNNILSTYSWNKIDKIIYNSEKVFDMEALKKLYVIYSEKNTDQHGCEAAYIIRRHNHGFHHQIPKISSWRK